MQGGLWMMLILSVEEVCIIEEGNAQRDELEKTFPPVQPFSTSAELMH